MLDIAEKQQVRIDVDALSTRLGCPVVPLVSTRGRGIRGAETGIDRHNGNVELVHYAQPLLREAEFLAARWPGRCLYNSATAGWVCKCWRAISTASGLRRRRRPAKHGHLTARLKDEMDDRRCISRRRPLPVYRRYLRRGRQYPDSRTSRFTGRSINYPEPLPRLTIFLFLMCLMFLLSPLTSAARCNLLMPVPSPSLFMAFVDPCAAGLVNHLHGGSWRRIQLPSAAGAANQG